MKSFAANDAKNRFATLLDDARREPVAIKRHGKTIAVIMLSEEYARLEKFEDECWASQADAIVAKNDWVGSDASQQALRYMLDV
jgi:prevent-host-death family protein